MKMTDLHSNRYGVRLGALLFSSVLIASCASVNPAKVDVKLPETAPVQKITNYTQSLHNLGLMTEIYNTNSLKIQSYPIGDNTGTSAASGGEIPKDITEMIKSALNSIGGNVIFIPYDPNFVMSQMNTRYSNFENKLIPDVVVSGGITEFDRGLETRGAGIDVGGEAEIGGLPIPLPSKKIAVDFSDSTKTGLARITLDFNLLDFKTMSGIARMNTVNSMEVTKALSEKEFGITLFGPTFGSKGSIKRVQGRHNAVRLLVEVSMIQMIGKNLAIPYWRLMDDDGQPDEVVTAALKRSYYQFSDAQRNQAAQEWLYLRGYDGVPNGLLDDATVAALKQFRPSFVPQGKSVDLDTFLQLYLSIPIDEKTLGRRMNLSNLMQAQQAPAVQTPVAEAPVPEAAQPPAPARSAKAQEPRDAAEKTSAAPASPFDNLSPEDRLTKSTEHLIEAGRYFRKRDYGKAAELFAENLLIRPSPETFFYLSLCHKEMKEDGRALGYLKEGTVKYPRNSLLWKSLGMLQYEKGEIEGARKALEEALRFSPDDRQSKFFLERLDVAKQL